MSDEQLVRSTPDVAPIAVNYLGAAPYLYYADATQALEWLVQVFGFAEKVRYVDSSGEVFQAIVTAGSAEFRLTCVGLDHWRAKGVEGPIGQLNVVYVNDVDLLYQRILAKLAGRDDLETAAGTSTEEIPEPRNQPYGARVFTVSDPGGNSWTFWQQISETVELPQGWREIKPAVDIK